MQRKNEQWIIDHEKRQWFIMNTLKGETKKEEEMTILNDDDLFGKLSRI